MDPSITECCCLSHTHTHPWQLSKIAVLDCAFGSQPPRVTVSIAFTQALQNLSTLQTHQRSLLASSEAAASQLSQLRTERDAHQRMSETLLAAAAEAAAAAHVERQAVSAGMLHTQEVSGHSSWLGKIPEVCNGASWFQPTACDSPVCDVCVSTGWFVPTRGGNNRGTLDQIGKGLPLSSAWMSTRPCCLLYACSKSVTLC